MSGQQTDRRKAFLGVEPAWALGVFLIIGIVLMFELI
jgi:hypothetical protein